MKIEVVGPGCPFCKRLYKRVREVAEAERIEAEILHVKDLRTALKYFPHTPVLIADGCILHRGKRLPSKERILELLRQVGPAAIQEEAK